MVKDAAIEPSWTAMTDCYKNGCTLTLPSRPHESKPSAVSANPVTTAGGPPNDLDLNASVKKLRPAPQQIVLISIQWDCAYHLRTTALICLHTASHLLHNNLSQVRCTTEGTFTLHGGVIDHMLQIQLITFKAESHL